MYIVCIKAAVYIKIICQFPPGSDKFAYPFSLQQKSCKSLVFPSKNARKKKNKQANTHNSVINKSVQEK